MVAVLLSSLPKELALSIVNGEDLLCSNDHTSLSYNSKHKTHRTQENTENTTKHITQQNTQNQAKHTKKQQNTQNTAEHRKHNKIKHQQNTVKIMYDA